MENKLGGEKPTSEADVVVVLKTIDSINLASNIELLSDAVQVFHSWVLLIPTKDFLRFLCPNTN